MNDVSAVPSALLTFLNDPLISPGESEVRTSDFLNDLGTSPVVSLAQTGTSPTVSEANILSASQQPIGELGIQSLGDPLLQVVLPLTAPTDTPETVGESVQIQSSQLYLTPPSVLPVLAAVTEPIATVPSVSLVTPEAVVNAGIKAQASGGRVIRRADLVASFGNITLPDTFEMGDLGRARVIVTNAGIGKALNSIIVKLYLSTDNKLDFDDTPNNGLSDGDILIGTKTQKISLRQGKSANFDFTYENITSGIAPGTYYLLADIDTNNSVYETIETNNTVSQVVSTPGTDVVLDWNATLLNAIQSEGQAGRGLPPTLGSRLLAIASTAVYDTLNSFERTHDPFFVDTEAPEGASLQAAVAGAAHWILTNLLPEQTLIFDQQLSRHLLEIQDGLVAEDDGVAFGQLIAQQFLDSRLDDGFDNSDPYVPPTGDGDYVWQPDLPDNIALGPFWGNVRPFAIPSDKLDDFAPDGLDGKPRGGDTARYIRDIEEVRVLGARENTDLTTITRNADQTEIARFWALDRADSFRPYGHLSQLAQIVALKEGNTLSENARLFAQLNVSLADAGVVIWRAKYVPSNLQPRPDDVITGGIALNDGFDETVHDPDWLPLLPTPPFPDYISGHSGFGGAFGQVLSRFYGDDYEFDAVSQELNGVVRRVTFEEAAIEDALSRIYGGIHVREATLDDSVPVGQAIADYVVDTLFQPVVV